jgi:hypothetical protein
VPVITAARPAPPPCPSSSANTFDAAAEARRRAAVSAARAASRAGSAGAGMSAAVIAPTASVIASASGDGAPLAGAASSGQGCRERCRRCGTSAGRAWSLSWRRCRGRRARRATAGRARSPPPAPLKYHLSGAWSRRIDDEHRLVYIVTEAEIIILAAQYHY